MLQRLRSGENGSEREEETEKKSGVKTFKKKKEKWGIIRKSRLYNVMPGNNVEKNKRKLVLKMNPP